MMVLKVFLICTLTLIPCTKTVEVTFKDVELRGYDEFQQKFAVKIESARNLKEALPDKIIFDTLQVVDASIPVLYENSVADIEDFEELILDNDEIQDIRPGALKNLPDTRTMSFKNNKLEELKYGVFNDLRVSFLNFSHNLLAKIDSQAFDNMTLLRAVDLSNNKLTAWDSAWFANTPVLVKILFQHNLISTLPANAFRNLAGEKQIGGYRLTVTIMLSHNQIQTLDPASFAGLTLVSNLELDNNQIERIDEDLFKGNQITFLKLNDNHISCLDGDLNKIFAVRYVTLNGNPWNCTCLEEIWNKISKDVVIEDNFSEIDCA